MCVRFIRDTLTAPWRNNDNLMKMRLERIVLEKQAKSQSGFRQAVVSAVKTPNRETRAT
jgi:hypothetical protein